MLVSVLAGHEEHDNPTTWYPCHQRKLLSGTTVQSYPAFLTSLSSGDSIRGLVKSLGDATSSTDDALAESAVDLPPSLQRVTLVQFVMNLSELDEGGNEVVKCWRYLRNELRAFGDSNSLRAMVKLAARGGTLT